MGHLRTLYLRWWLVGEQARISQLSYEDATSRLSSERDEQQRQNAGLQRHQAQVQHELKRKDREYERLQDRCFHGH